MHCQSVCSQTASDGSVVSARVSERKKKSRNAGGVGQDPEVHQVVLLICSQLKEEVEAVPQLGENIENEGTLWGGGEGVGDHLGCDEFEFGHKKKKRWWWWFWRWSHEAVFIVEGVVGGESEDLKQKVKGASGLCFINNR